jgi:hypothetical protein
MNLIVLNFFKLLFRLLGNVAAYRMLVKATLLDPRFGNQAIEVEQEEANLMQTAIENELLDELTEVIEKSSDGTLVYLKTLQVPRARYYALPGNH